ncbi:MAG: hypothetical protein ABSF26_27270 [Thermoguttaceae bacterium]
MMARWKRWSLPALLVLLGGLALVETAQAAPPAEWTARQIGTPKGAGSVQEKGGASAVTAGGNSPEGQEARKGNDELFFVSREVSGDFAMVARLKSLEGIVNSRAALMVRQSAAADAKYVMLSFRDNRLYGNRRDFGPSLANQGIDWALGERSGITLPVWLKLVRWQGYVCASASSRRMERWSGGCMARWGWCSSADSTRPIPRTCSARACIT